MATIDVPTVGRIVHFVVDASAATELSKLGNALPVGEHASALVVRVWGDTPTSCVNLQVFADGLGSVWVTSVRGDQHDYSPRSWHYPERSNA